MMNNLASKKKGNKKMRLRPLRKVKSKKITKYVGLFSFLAVASFTAVLGGMTLMYRGQISEEKGEAAIQEQYIVCPGPSNPKTCQNGETLCGHTCVDLNTDKNNCGSCGNVCPTNGSCAVGVCGTSTVAPTATPTPVIQPPTATPTPLPECTDSDVSRCTINCGSGSVVCSNNQCGCIGIPPALPECNTTSDL